VIRALWASYIRRLSQFDTLSTRWANAKHLIYCEIACLAASARKHDDFALQQHAVSETILSCILCNIFVDFVICVSCDRTSFGVQRKRANLFSLQIGSVLLMDQLPLNSDPSDCSPRGGSRMLNVFCDGPGDFQHPAHKAQSSLAGVPQRCGCLAPGRW